MALFERDRLPSRSALSRWLAALTVEPVEALRARFLSDLLARPLGTQELPGGVTDRAGTHYLVFDVDGTREAARQRALPKTPDRPPAQRRLRPLCAPGYLGRKRGEVVRTRTTVLQAHTHQPTGCAMRLQGAGTPVVHEHTPNTLSMNAVQKFRWPNAREHSKESHRPSDW
jgi:hypothetical protein